MEHHVSSESRIQKSLVCCVLWHGALGVNGISWLSAKGSWLKLDLLFEMDDGVSSSDGLLASLLIKSEANKLLHKSLSSGQGELSKWADDLFINCHQEGGPTCCFPHQNPNCCIITKPLESSRRVCPPTELGWSLFSGCRGKPRPMVLHNHDLLTLSESCRFCLPWSNTTDCKC